ncbi:MAG: hypothetical protein JWO22_346 [Frankiales bacterium]|nr:hypothetical protein [Frankiales bacterium]
MRAPRILVLAAAVLVPLSLTASAQGPPGFLDDYLPNHPIGSAATFSSTVLPSTPGRACDQGSLPESGRQGRVPLADYASGRAAKGYTCNARVVTHYGTTGGFRVERYTDRAGHDCAFYDSSLITGKDLQKDTPGTYVMDMTDPLHPKRTAVLRSPAMLSPHESLRVNARSGLLVADMGSPTTQVGFVDVYDVKQDCRNPQIQASLPLAVLGHEGGFSPDGRTYWATTTATGGITAIDLTTPTLPKVVWRSTGYAVHGVSISADGNRAYLAEVANDGLTTITKGGGGLVVLDISQVQKRVPNPTVTELSELTWPEVTIPQNALPVTIRGHRYVIEFDEFDSDVTTYTPKENVGGVHIIDIADERHPRVVSRIRLAVWDAKARATDQQSDPGASAVGQGYAAHYCNVPAATDPGLLACSMIASGLRVFDIRDPLHPREVAYANTPALGTDGDPLDKGGWAMSSPAFVPQRHEIWYSDTASGLFVVRLSQQAWTARS